MDTNELPLGTALLSPAEAREQWNSSEGWSSRWVPSQALMEVLKEWLVRWPCPASSDEEHHVRRMCLLIWDCRAHAADVLREAGAYVGRIPNRPNVMPSASEIEGAILAMVQDEAARRAAGDHGQAAGGSASPVWEKAHAYRRLNRQALEAGSPWMHADDGEIFSIGGYTEMRGARSDGSIITPRWDSSAKQWTVSPADRDALADCYRRHSSKFHVGQDCVVRRRVSAIL